MAAFLAYSHEFTPSATGQSARFGTLGGTFSSGRELRLIAGARAFDLGRY
jgi:hypothetical protein